LICINGWRSRQAPNAARRNVACPRRYVRQEAGGGAAAVKALLQAKCRRWLRLVSPIITVGVIGVGATLLVWQRTVSAENQALVEQLANRADNQAVILAGGMGDYRDKLYAVRAFFNASSEVTREEFETFRQRIADRSTGDPQYFMAAQGNEGRARGARDRGRP
jgi:hypothetical protein